LTFTATDIPDEMARIHFNSNGTMTISTAFEMTGEEAVTITVGDGREDGDGILQWPPAYRGVGLFEA
jgi:hypothetical protein